MRTRGHRSSGFTLIELLVVVIIVAVLAAVGIPMLSANVIRAKASEAEAGLGTIRTALRAEFAELGEYPALTKALPHEAGISINLKDLDGRYFTTGSYRITSSATGYCISVDGSVAPGLGADAGSKDIERSMDQDGQIFEKVDCA